jgi:hypothetical protein
MSEGTNVFIDFSIIQKSNPSSLYKELDLLIRIGKTIHLWSKTVPIKQMKEYCKKLQVTPEDYDATMHAKVFINRHKDKKTYQSIADELGIKLDVVSFYVNCDPTKPWVLDDWIIGYHFKDSAIYEKVDILIDNDKILVDRFKRANRSAHYVEKV